MLQLLQPNDCLQQQRVTTGLCRLSSQMNHDLINRYNKLTYIAGPIPKTEVRDCIQFVFHVSLNVHQQKRSCMCLFQYVDLILRFNVLSFD